MSTTEKPKRRFKPGDRVVIGEHAPEVFRRGRKELRHGHVVEYYLDGLLCRVHWDDGFGPQTCHHQDDLRREPEK